MVAGQVGRCQILYHVECFPRAVAAMRERVALVTSNIFLGRSKQKICIYVDGIASLSTQTL